MSEQRKRLLCAAGVFLALLGVYLLTAPGRIEMIDGQWRYEVAKNWLDSGDPSVSDRYLFLTRGQILNPRTGQSYSVYNGGPSVTAMPWMALSRRLPGHTAERDHFAFSLTGPFFGALLGALLILGYGLLGVGLRPSVIATAIFCLATLWWPASVTVFDQNQHAVLLLAAVLLAWQSGRRENVSLAGVGGLAGGLLLNFQEMYVMLLPAVGLAVFASAEEGLPRHGVTARRSLSRAGLLRYLAFALGCCVGVGLFAAFNYLRFQAPFLLARYGSPAGAQGAAVPPMWGDFFAGFVGLTLSFGKGMFWFSPPLALALVGARGLLARAPVLGLTVAGVSAIHLIVIMHLTFFGGDWCWGPRYTVPVMPLCALVFPFAAARLGRSRRLIALLATAGVLVQIQGVSLDYHRFFYDRCLQPSFWADDPWFYVGESQLLARPFELVETIRTRLPREATRFSPSPSGQTTYCPSGPGYAAFSRSWVRHFQVFYLPRPWWGWVGRVRPEERPVDPRRQMAACVALLVLGGGLLAISLRASPRDSRESADSLVQDSLEDPGPAVPAGGSLLARSETAALPRSE